MLNHWSKIELICKIKNSLCSLWGEIIFCRGGASPGVPPAFLFGRSKRKFCRKPARHHPAADSHAPALHRTGSYPAAGRWGTPSVPRKKAISPYLKQSIRITDDCTTNRNGEKQENGVMLRDDDPFRYDKKEDCFRRASYLAKTNTKGNTPKGQRELFSSRIPKNDMH